MKKGLQFQQIVGIILVIAVLIFMILIAKNISTLKEVILNIKIGPG